METTLPTLNKLRFSIWANTTLMQLYSILVSSCAVFLLLATTAPSLFSMLIIFALYGVIVAGQYTIMVLRMNQFIGRFAEEVDEHAASEIERLDTHFRQLPT